MKISTFGAVSAAFALCAMAGAQTTAVAPLGVSLRLGAFLPTNDTTIDATSNSMFAFGVDYKLGYTPPSVGGFTSSAAISVDYFHKGDYGNIPVLLNYVGTTGRLSVSAGAGVGFTSLPGADSSKFAYQFGLAYDLPTDSATPVFVAAKFFGSEQSRLNGVGVYVGIKF